MELENRGKGIDSATAFYAHEQYGFKFTEVQRRGEFTSTKYCPPLFASMFLLMSTSGALSSLLRSGGFIHMPPLPDMTSKLTP